MTNSLSDELRSAWAEIDRLREVLRSIEWSGSIDVWWDGVTAACCPACSGVKPGEATYGTKVTFDHFEDCALHRALAPTHPLGRGESQ
jgi:hypothetical protein